MSSIYEKAGMLAEKAKMIADNYEAAIQKYAGLQAENSALISEIETLRMANAALLEDLDSAKIKIDEADAALQKLLSFEAAPVLAAEAVPEEIPAPSEEAKLEGPAANQEPESKGEKSADSAEERSKMMMNLLKKYTR